MCNYNTEYFSTLSKTGCHQNNKGPSVKTLNRLELFSLEGGRVLQEKTNR